uniref:Uncharacterized protein n=1 Tax=Chromera velia CCMP2878 TaxID=1169474 RepID=A0A0G4IA52_9ALVE|eukprot:Cvel_12457.t1-p1 / transcript=Cvel_12457.t1 / gene=Cvel_12457 / organism=Chromera_velia_CCMP2878 / gene_product=hypothetical protein / transcript_product=hypothetical protein / location=Cvel_scaffold816:15749-18360(+) / protein_length=316 / sequence_SO=supercontig / SO=protein_coding / is_pseudo=false
MGGKVEVVQNPVLRSVEGLKTLDSFQGIGLRFSREREKKTYTAAWTWRGMEKGHLISLLGQTLIPNRQALIDGVIQVFLEKEDSGPGTIADDYLKKSQTVLSDHWQALQGIPVPGAVPLSAEAALEEVTKSDSETFMKTYQPMKVISRARFLKNFMVGNPTRIGSNLSDDEEDVQPIRRERRPTNLSDGRSRARMNRGPAQPKNPAQRIERGEKIRRANEIWQMMMEDKDAEGAKAYRRTHWGVAFNDQVEETEFKSSERPLAVREKSLRMRFHSSLPRMSTSGKSKQKGGGAAAFADASSSSSSASSAPAQVEMN